MILFARTACLPLLVLCVYVCEPGCVEHVMCKKKSQPCELLTVVMTHAHVHKQNTHSVLIEQPPYKYERVFQVAPFTNQQCNLICNPIAIATLCVLIITYAAYSSLFMSICVPSIRLYWLYFTARMYISLLGHRINASTMAQLSQGFPV